MTYCSSCGEKIVDPNAVYCGSCGASLKVSEKPKGKVENEPSKQKSINPLQSIVSIILFIGIFYFAWNWIFPSHEGPINVSPSAITFHTLDKYFGSGSNLTDLQKDLKWNDYEDRYVRWTGTVETVGTSFGDPYIGLKMKETTWSYDVHISFRDGYINRLTALNKGDKVTVIGKILRGGGFLISIHLVDGRLTN